MAQRRYIPLEFMIFGLEILAHHGFHVYFLSFFRRFPDQRSKSNLARYPIITTVSLFKTKPIITEGIYLSALLHTNRQAAIYTAVYHCATGTEFDNQFQPKAFCLQIMACHVMCHVMCHLIRPTHPPLSYHPNNIWR